MFKKKKTVEQVVPTEVPEVETKESEVSVTTEVEAVKEVIPQVSELEDVAISIVKDKKSLTYSVLCVRFNKDTGEVGKLQVLHEGKDIGEAEYLFKIESVHLGIFR